MTPCACSLQKGELTAHDDKFQQKVKALAEVHAAESHRMTHPRRFVLHCVIARTPETHLFSTEACSINALGGVIANAN
jgi:hypothetical protein